MVPGESPRASVSGCVFACQTGFSVTINIDEARKAVAAVKRVLGGRD
jgi:dihydrodipicolinate synthase/N-acetylneuraminate lyase